MLTVFFFLHPKANRQKDQRNNPQPQGRSLCPHSAFPCSHRCPSQTRRTAGPTTAGTPRACGCAELKSPRLPATHCCLPGSCLPRCLQGRYSHGASWQAPTGLPRSASSRSKLPALGMAMGTGCPVAPWKRCSTSPLAPVISALLLPQFAMPWCPIPHSTYPFKYLLVAGTVLPCQVGGGRRVWVEGTAIRLCSQGTIKQCTALYSW